MYIAQTTKDFEQAKTALMQVSDALFNWSSLGKLVLCVLVAVVLGAIIAKLLRYVTKALARAADASKDLTMVNRLRRLETIVVIVIAVSRLFLLVIAVYIWWIITHPSGTKPNAILGAGALTAVIIGGMLTPLLRDFSFGAGMMAERWFGVGDLISIDFPDVQGVVERITLRSTRLRGLNGEVIWVANQTINGVKVAQNGVHATAVELFVTDKVAGEELIDTTNKLLPGGLSLLVSPMRVVEVVQTDNSIWHITAIGETAPGREWILEKNALDILKKLDERRRKPILIIDPVARYADPDMERELVRAVRNARKKRAPINYRQAIGTLAVKRGKTK